MTSVCHLIGEVIVLVCLFCGSKIVSISIANKWGLGKKIDMRAIFICDILLLMNKGRPARKNILDRGQHEKQLDEILRLTKDTNAMLRGERNVRRIKLIVTLVLLLSGAGYGYYLFDRYKIEIIEFQQRVEELQDHLQEAAEVAGKVGETAGSIRDIFEGLESEPSQSQTE